MQPYDSLNINRVKIDANTLLKSLSHISHNQGNKKRICDISHLRLVNVAYRTCDISHMRFVNVTYRICDIHFHEP